MLKDVEDKSHTSIESIVRQLRRAVRAKSSLAIASQVAASSLDVRHALVIQRVRSLRSYSRRSTLNRVARYFFNTLEETRSKSNSIREFRKGPEFCGNDNQHKMNEHLWLLSVRNELAMQEAYGELSDEKLIYKVRGFVGRCQTINCLRFAR